MSKPLRVLVVDDSEADALLLIRRIKQAGYAPTSSRVDTAEALRSALSEGQWDVVVCDYHMPGFGALAALDVARELGTSIPFVVVSGVIGEEAAADCMRAGAHDFVLKDNLARLVPALEREIAESARRAEQARMKAQLERSEELLIRSEKLRALGEMAAGISHDLKNILNPISLHIQLLERAIARGLTDDAKGSLVEMRGILARGLSTVERLRDYGRSSPQELRERIDLDQLVREARAISHPRMVTRGSGRHRVVEELGAPPPVIGHPGDVLAAIVNLIVNAVDAMPDGGTVQLCTGTSEGGSFVRIRDDGPGMPEEVQRRVFEPFFTTKGDKGTGLGLAMVSSCMQRHGGKVLLETSPGKGTSFTLWFPAEGTAVLEPPTSMRATVLA